jgi:hypothetical protein
MTTKKKPKVYITRKLPDAVETRMRELFDAELNIDGPYPASTYAPLGASLIPRAGDGAQRA